MAALSHLFPTCSSNDMRYCLSALSTLARSHTAAGEKFNLVTITVAVGDSHADFAGSNFLTTTDNSAIIRHT
jgi:hypothetical protein